MAKIKISRIGHDLSTKGWHFLCPTCHHKLTGQRVCPSCGTIVRYPFEKKINLPDAKPVLAKKPVNKSPLKSEIFHPQPIDQPRIKSQKKSTQSAKKKQAAMWRDSTKHHWYKNPGLITLFSVVMIAVFLTLLILHPFSKAKTSSPSSSSQLNGNNQISPMKFSLSTFESVKIGTIGQKNGQSPTTLTKHFGQPNKNASGTNGTKVLTWKDDLGNQLIASFRDNHAFSKTLINASAKGQQSVSSDKYDQIDKKMTVDEVVNILGNPNSINAVYQNNSLITSYTYIQTTKSKKISYKIDFKHDQVFAKKHANYS